MIEAQYYYGLYLFTIVALTIVETAIYSTYSNQKLIRHFDKSQNQIFPIVFTAIMAVFVGMRPISGLFVDMKNYQIYYRVITGNKFEFDWSQSNYLFDNLFNYMASDKIAIASFFMVISIIYFGFIYIACRKLFPTDTLYALIIYLGAFSTFSYGTNGIKAGAAAAFFLCALAYQSNWKLCLLFLFFSLGFHHSMAMPIAAFIICRFISNPKLYIFIWVIALAIAAFHITYFQTLLGSFSEDGAGYLADNSKGYRTGFRIDFLIYSFLPIALGYWYIFKCHYKSKVYNLIFNTYVLTNAVWILCMYASFTNRIAYLSWLMIPFVLVYPLFNKVFIRRQYAVINAVAWYHLGFTLFMYFVYYSFIH